MRRGNRVPLITMSIAVCAALLNGCADRAEERRELKERFAQAEYEILEGNYDVAQEMLKEFLLERPENSGAHFYLGRTYAFGSSFRPDMAEGELQFALQLFHERGRKSTIERFQDDYFEVICNIESAKVCVLQIKFMQNLQAPPIAYAHLIARAEVYVARAKTIHPESNDVTSYEAILRDLKS